MYKRERPAGEGRSAEEEKAKRRPPSNRKVVDYSGPLMRLVVERLYASDLRPSLSLQPERSYGRHLLLPAAYAPNCAAGVCARLAHTALNYPRAPINSLAWMPGGHRLLTGSQARAAHDATRRRADPRRAAPRRVVR
jgi:hypothetical protein